MSYIGTLRSLGMSTARTGRILLLENVLYALLGSIPATILYSFIRLPILNLMFMGEDSSGNAVEFELPGYPVALVIGVILGAVLIECLIPLRAILKALKTSIRDIIFDNRDTEYKFNRSTLIFGLICLAVAIPTFFLRKNIFFATICLVAAVAALAFLFPRILKLVTTGIKKIADKFEKSTWSLASVEAISRKSTVGSGVLCATAAAMCIVVYALTGGLSDSINVVPYNCDVVMETTKENKYYTYIEHLDGVTDSENLYTALKLITVNDETKEGYGYYFGMPDGGFKYYEGFKGLPDKIEEGCVCLDKSFASRKGIKTGDTIKITINPESVFPVTREYKVTNIVECNNNGYSGESIIVNEAEYKFLFRDTPGQILIKCDDPEAIKKTLETYAKGNYDTVETYDEKVENLNENNSKTIAVVTAIIIVALGMTAIGMISNQLIGFEGRKKECAVMLSTAMNKSKLSGILLKEVLITSTTASAAGTIVGTILTFVLKTAMASAQTVVMDINVNPLHNLLFFAIMSVIFTATVLFPIRNLRKMKIAEQIKYE
jgi:ABC-type antimicrobial peptide transport system permease subunit